MSDQTLRTLVYGKGAHADPVACVEDISAEVASRRASGYPHTIWQLVLHMNFWMDYDLRTIAGENPTYPEHAIESWPELRDPSNEDDWKATVRAFSDLLNQVAVLADSDSEVLERAIVKAGAANSRRECSVHAALWEIAAHNSYHTGQVALLRRQSGAWPPERGGDSW